MKILLANGALISARTRDELLETPLHVAVRRGACFSSRRAAWQVRTAARQQLTICFHEFKALKIVSRFEF